MRSQRLAGHLSAAARTIHALSLPIILFWVALTIVVNVVAPQLQSVARTHSVALGPHDAPSLIAMKRIGKDFQQFDSDTTAMVLLEGQEKLGDEAHRFYDVLVTKLSQDTTHVQHIENFWGDPLTAAGSQSADGKAAYVQLNLTGDQGGSQANESVAAVQRIVDSVPPPPGIKAYVTGPGPLGADRVVYGDRSLHTITGISIAVIAIMLFIAYRSLSAALIMLLTVGLELLAVRGIISTFAVNDLMGLSTFTVNVLVALTIAASTDYIIFLVGRYQEARATGQNREAAYYTMFGGTAHVVLASGLTVAGAIGYLASDRHFPQARMEPEVLMVEADHDLRNPTDMLILDRIAKTVFHTPGIARVQSITRPLGAPIDHSSIPFQLGMQSTMTIENLQNLKDRVADLSTLTDQLQRMIDITQRTQELTRQLTDATHDMNAHTRQMRDNANELRDRIADFDDFWRPLRSFTYWERHCFDIPICWSMRSLLNSMDNVDKLTEDLANLTDDTERMDTTQRQLLAQLDPTIATMQTVKDLAQTLTSAFSGLVTQMEDMTRNATVMGRTFDAANNDDSFYLPPEAFQNPDFQRGLKLFLSPDGTCARFVITHRGDPASAEGISHIDPIMQAADEAVKGTPLQAASIYLAGTSSTYKDIHEGTLYDVMIAVVASLCLIFIIMLGITRSVVASAVIVGTVALSLGSAFGLSVLIWQHILHMPLHWLVLPMAIIVMLAVGSDYNLLLIARFQEEIGAGLKTGMIRAMAGTGRVVTIAGLVFAFTMGSMVASDLRVVGQIGTTIMIGLLFDTLVVRSYMTPALATLLGRWFWWPRRVDRLARQPQVLGPRRTTALSAERAALLQ